MSYFVVIRETGPAWNADKPLREQAAWDEHADFINAAAEDGLVLVGGALGDGGSFLLFFNAQSEAEIRRRLDDDPWTRMELLHTASIEPWEQLTGPDLVAAAKSALA